MSKNWTEQEIEKLISLRATNTPIKDINIAGRSYIAIKGKIAYLIKEGRLSPSAPSKRWTIEEESLLAELVAANNTVEAISTILCRTPSAIRSKRKLITKEARPLTSWTEEDLLKLNPNKSYKHLAEELGRSESAVGSKMQRLGLLKNKVVYSDQYLLSLVRKYKTLHFFNDNKLESEPSHNTLVKRFGSWSKAVEAAGLPRNTGNMRSDKSTILYLVDFGKFKKVGITQRSIRDRFMYFPKYEILDQVTFEELEPAIGCEQEILSKVYKINGDLPNGNTECFVSNHQRLEDLL